MRPASLRKAGWIALAAFFVAIFVPTFAPSSATAQDSADDDFMGGFDDDFDVADIESTDASMPGWMEHLPFGQALYDGVDIGGSLSFGAVYGILDHSVGHGDQPGRRTPWGNFSRLDLDGQLQIDVDLTHGWTARGELIAWYDFAYRARGRGQYGAPS